MLDPPYAGTQVSRRNVVPLISSEVVGPLGLMHLPRIWLKALLHATDSLAEDWGFGAGGLDKITMEFVGIDPAAFVPWLLREFPTYAQCEAWVRANARSLDPDSIARANDFLSTEPLPRGLGPKFRAYLSIDDERFDVGIRLNNVDDWTAVQQYAARYGTSAGPIVPAISPRTSGPLGIAGLPRDWLITLLRAHELLPPGYDAAEVSDAGSALRRLGVDPVAARAYVAATRPAYTQYERWLRATGAFDAATIEDVNAAVDAASALAVEEYDRAFLHRALAERRTPNAVVRGAGVISFSVTASLSARA